MTTDVSVVKYTKKHAEAHVIFAKKMWSKKVRTTPEYVQWKFRITEDHGNYSFYLAFDGDKVIGQIGAITGQVRCPDHSVKVAWWCDLMVDNEYRGKNIAQSLYRFMIADLHDYKHMGSDPSPAAEKSMKRYGFTEIPSTDKFYLPVDVIAFLRSKFKWLPNYLTLPNFFASFLLKVLSFNKSSYHEISLNELSDQSIRALHPVNSDCFQAQSKESLVWRFKERPLYKIHSKVYSNGDDSMFVLYKAGHEIRIAPINNCKLDYIEALYLCYTFAKKSACSKIHIRANQSLLPMFVRAMLYKSNHQTCILSLGQERNELSRFSYSLLDSDEYI